MNFPELALHDAHLVALEHDTGQRRLRLRLRRMDGSLLQLEFVGVEDMNLFPFGPQNILFELARYSASDEGTLAFCQELGSSPHFVEEIMAGRLTLFHLDPSVGMGGHILAQDMLV